MCSITHFYFGYYFIVLFLLSDTKCSDTKTIVNKVFETNSAISSQHLQVLRDTLNKKYEQRIRRSDNRFSFNHPRLPITKILKAIERRIFNNAVGAYDYR